MQAYENKPITEADWERVAGSLTCEINVLKAIAKVESGERSAFWVINDTAKHKVHAPKIMFERHYFHRLTCANGPRQGAEPGYRSTADPADSALPPTRCHKAGKCYLQ